MQREAKFIGWFALVLGCTGILHGLILLAGWANQPEGVSCKAICGLVLLSRSVLGDFFGPLVGGVLWLTVGAAFCRLGYLALKK